MPPQPGLTISHYKLVEKLGEGGMGVVWKAEDLVLGRTVAVKLLPADVSRDETRRKMFMDEARLASTIGHAHVAQVYELGNEGDLDFIVMELVEGKPLSKILHGRPVPPDKVAAIGLQVADGLARTHRKGILHRDLKPANILVTADGDVKIVDLGLATLFQRSELSIHGDDKTVPPTFSDDDRSDPGRAPHGGTLAYMSPEQARGEKLDGRTDIFSLGIVLYEMAVGQRPFVGSASADTLRAILRAKPQAPHELVPKLPLELERIILKALAPNKADRYQTMEDLAVDLKRLGRELESGSSPSYEDLKQVLKGERWWRQPRIVAAAVGGVVLLGALGGWLALRARTPALDPKTVLVLPFEVRGRTDGVDFIGRAFAESIAVNLATAKDLRVLPVGSASATGQDATRLARAANAGSLIVGSVTRSGDTAEIGATLLDASTDRVREGVRETTTFDQLDMGASKAAARISRILGGTRPKLYPWIGELTGGADMAQSDLLRQCVIAVAQNRYDAGGVACEQLTERFSNESDAWALLSWAYQQRWWVSPAELDLVAAQRADARCSTLDPDSPYPAMSRAFFESNSPGPQVAVETLKLLATRGDWTPSGRAWSLRRLAGALLRSDRFALAETAAREALSMQPSNAYTLRTLASAVRQLGRPEEAISYLVQAKALAPLEPDIDRGLAVALDNLGRYDEAAEAVRGACDSVPAAACPLFAVMLFKSGKMTAAEAVYSNVKDLRLGGPSRYSLARYQALVGRKHAALASLRAALGGLQLSDETEPDFDSLRNEPEFKAIFDELRRKRAVRH